MPKERVSPSRRRRPHSPVNSLWDSLDGHDDRRRPRSRRQPPRPLGASPLSSVCPREPSTPRTLRFGPLTRMGTARRLRLRPVPLRTPGRPGDVGDDSDLVLVSKEQVWGSSASCATSPGVPTQGDRLLLLAPSLSRARPGSSVTRGRALELGSGFGAGGPVQFLSAGRGESRRALGAGPGPSGRDRLSLPLARGSGGGRRGEWSAGSGARGVERGRRRRRRGADRLGGLRRERPGRGPRPRGGWPAEERSAAPAASPVPPAPRGRESRGRGPVGRAGAGALGHGTPRHKCRSLAEAGGRRCSVRGKSRRLGAATEAGPPGPRAAEPLRVDRAASWALEVQRRFVLGQLVGNTSRTTDRLGKSS